MLLPIPLSHVIISSREAIPYALYEFNVLMNIKRTQNKTEWGRTKWATVGIEFIVLFLFWIILSGQLKIKYLLIGMFASALVTFLTHELIYNKTLSIGKGTSLSYIFKCASRFMLYLPWLILAIMKANITIALILIRPRMPIDPGFLQLETKLKKSLSLVTLANSITLTPGTITVELEDGKFIIHSLVHKCAGDLETSLMQNKVARIFGDNEDTTSPKCLWVHSQRELKE